MKLRHAAALAYILGWALVLSALITSAKQNGTAAFVVIDYQANKFFAVVTLAWIFFSVPVAIVIAIAA